MAPVQVESIWDKTASFWIYFIEKLNEWYENLNGSKA